MTRPSAALAAAVVLSALVAGGACGSAGEPAPPTSVERGTWTAIEKEIITGSCAFASCHGGARPAANLDLSVAGACRELVERTSCLFPTRRLVVPGQPDDSFLMAKLTGDGLSAAPEVECGTGTNRRMPFGAPQLGARQLALVNSWIAAGADCEDGTTPVPTADGGVTADGDVDAGAGDGMPNPDGGAADAVSGAAVVSLLPAPATVVAGQRASLDLTLDRPAGSGGVAVTLTVSNDTIVGVPATVIVPEGQAALALTVVGKRPGSARIVARAAEGTAALEIDVAVTGLLLSEVLPVGATLAVGSSWIEVANTSDAPIDLVGYRLGLGINGFSGATTSLTGILPPGGCFVVGGPHSDAGNGAPVYAQVWDVWAVFGAGGRDPNQSFAVGLFEDVNPVDAVTFGGVGEAPVPPPGHSLTRDGPALWRDEAVPTPGRCQIR